MTQDTMERPKNASTIHGAKDITTRGGLRFDTIRHGNSVTLVSHADPNQNVIVTGPVTMDLSVGGVISGILDDIAGALKALKGILSCTPTQTTQVTVGSDGKVTGITVTNTCVPN